ncbi:hypothetical protein [Sphingomonas sp. KC8]|uniref:hypothetical protein n=1 Tax=Sphingomonas sp. KC8 TaxID=1030157 RepID=UPI000248A40A|nr:hypothetical protein [Sphingomonas sp. KC8]ARS27362.1 hypothetical protein KC8_08655 [Sphingomonas sp. KC8]
MGEPRGMIPEITGRDARFRSALPPEDCVAGLARVLTPAADVAFTDDGPDMIFAGAVGEHGLHIACRHRKKAKDSEFALHARIYKDGPATQIRGRFRLPSKGSAYLIFWFCSMIAFAIYLQWSPILAPTERMVLLAAPIGMIAFVLLTSWLHRGRLTRDEAAISALLAEHIGARRYRLKSQRSKRRR